MNLDLIARLVRRLERSDLSELDFSDGAFELQLRMTPGPAAEAARPPGPAPATTLRAGAIGLLRLHHPAEGPAAPAFPRAVRAGDVVAFLEAGPVLRPVVADTDCTIGEPLQGEGTLVGYGTPLFPLL